MKIGILFDLDGTLWDSVPQVCAAFNRVFDRHPELHKHLTEEELRGYMGKQRMEVAAVMMPMAPPERWYDLMEELFAEQLPYLREHHAAPYPHLVQTLEGTPAIIHGGPFANIAHGCNSVQATKLALKLGDIAITEAGFGADLGAEKFMDSKCRKAGLAPDCIVLVATVRALKYNGGVAKADLNQPNMDALKHGICNLDAHLDNMKKFGVPVVVAVNAFPTDTDEEMDFIREHCAERGVRVALSEVFAKGGEGGQALANEVLAVLEESKADFHMLYEDSLPLEDKIRKIAKEIYGALGVTIAPAAKKELANITEMGYGNLPVCVAKTQYSLSDDASLLGRPTEFVVNVRTARLAAGAGFVVVETGSIMTMPGLPKVPSAEKIDVDSNGKITGLF